MSIIIQIVWFFLPAIIANIAPVFAQRYNLWPKLNQPLDKGYTWQDKRLLGDNKTLRGLIIGIIAGTITGALQGSALLGLSLSLGALWGDILKSLIKRRFNINPGSSWAPWDQVDFVIGASLISFMLSPQPFYYYLIAILILGFGSYLTSYIGIRLGIKKSL